MVRIPKNGIEKQQQPSFFKIMFPSYSTEHLRIPPKFLRHIDYELSKRATLKLKRSSVYSWNVKVIRSGRDVYFKDGWQEFLRDTSLGDKEVLVFIYNGKMCFSIKIFDKNACERMDFSDIKTHQNSRSSKRQRAHKLKEVKEKEHDYTNTGKSTSKSTERPTKTTSESSKRPRGRPRKYPVTCSDHLRPLNSCKENSGKHIPNSEFDALKEVKEEEEDYQESAELFKSKLLYFTQKILRLTQVYVAKPFYKENLSSGKYEFVFLKNSEGTKWVGSLCQFQFLKQNKILVHILNK
ncbi:hypothetical protein M0R45_007921 [Rubus argutus]|uniref:TF-B3 domain-containing protein n=1 Tax=Rubus argutus TaxID=59490 RepID=A0AAW1XZV0_RUBAR